MRKFITLLLLATGLTAYAQQNAPLPVDPKVKTGKLDNGLTYYIRQNSLPENRADFYIAQKVGSMQEEDNQAGLAHFLEHMAFNGTKNFPKKTMLNYLQDNGIKFGTNINAYTSFDETVYYISDIPTTNQNLMDLSLIHISSHKSVLENPDSISKVVLRKGLDAGTAFEILSIDIADIDIGKNIGAVLQMDQAQADKNIAQARAEERRAMAIALEQEMKARCV